MAIADVLAQRADEAAQQADRLRKAAELAQQLGDEGLRELLALVAPEQHTNGKANGSGHHVSRSEPRGREAVRLIVGERPGIWTLTELREEMQAREWFTSRNGLEAAVKRLCVSGEARRLSPGRFIFPANHGEEASHEQELGGAMFPAT